MHITMSSSGSEQLRAQVLKFELTMSCLFKIQDLTPTMGYDPDDGLPDGRMVVVGYTPRGADRHVFSMRKANER